MEKGIEEKLKRLQEIAEELSNINFDKELTEDAKKQYINHLGEFEEIAINNPESYDMVNEFVNNKKELANPTVIKSMDEIARISELKNKYDSVVKDNLAKRTEIINKYAEKFNIEELAGNIERKSKLEKDAINKAGEALNALEELKSKVDIENERIKECNSALDNLNDIEKIIGEVEAKKKKINELEESDNIEPDFKKSQIELRKNELNKYYKNINNLSAKYNKNYSNDYELPNFDGNSNTDEFRGNISEAKKIVNNKITEINNNILNIKDSKANELEKKGIEFDKNIKGADLENEIDKKRTELRNQNTNLNEENGRLNSKLSAINEVIGNENEQNSRDVNNTQGQQNNTVEQNNSELYSQDGKLTFTDKVKRKFNMLLEQERRKGGKEVKGIRKVLLGIRSLFGVNNNSMLNAGQEEVNNKKDKINSFKEQYKVDLINRVMHEEDLSKINDTVVDKIYDDMAKNDKENEK